LDGLRKIVNKKGNARSSCKPCSYIALCLDLNPSVSTAGREIYGHTTLLVSLLLVKFRLHETNKNALRLRVYSLNVNQGERALQPRICIQEGHRGEGPIQVPYYLVKSQ
jgi:hypothetical protein